MSVKNSVSAIPLKSIDSATFTGSYQLIYSGGTPNACFLLSIINNSNKDITVSYDGATDHDFVPTLKARDLPVQTNSQPNNKTALFAAGTKVWVKGVAGTGLVYLAGYYQVVAN
jgi:hypothetical protein